MPLDFWVYRWQAFLKAYRLRNGIDLRQTATVNLVLDIGLEKMFHVEHFSFL